MGSVANILDHPRVYRAWQAPFVAKKLHPVLRSGVLERSSSVLDVGCGPGTNAASFSSISRYVGIDLNSAYIAYARRHFEGDFRVGDVRKGLDGGETFDLVLMNSLMHHLDDDGVTALLESLELVVAPGGEIHVLDLVLPDRGLKRLMALADRGEHPRSPSQWVDLVGRSARVDSFDLYDLGIGPIGLWGMIHMTLSTQPG